MEPVVNGKYSVVLGGNADLLLMKGDELLNRISYVTIADGSWGIGFIVMMSGDKHVCVGTGKAGVNTGFRIRMVELATGVVTGQVYVTLPVTGRIPGTYLDRLLALSTRSIYDRTKDIGLPGLFTKKKSYTSKSFTENTLLPSSGDSAVIYLNNCRQLGVRLHNDKVVCITDLLGVKETPSTGGVVYDDNGLVVAYYHPYRGDRRNVKIINATTGMCYGSLSIWRPGASLSGTVLSSVCRDLISLQVPKA